MACSNFPDCRNTKAIVSLIVLNVQNVMMVAFFVESNPKKNRVFYGRCNIPYNATLSG
ncbi:hypothetical protein ACVPOW_02865 [Staphylococcus aureus]